MTDTATPTSNRNRSTPKRAGKVAGIPKSSKNGFWATEVESLRKEPGETFKYEDVSQTTASYLKRTYGVNATTRNNTDGGRADLYVSVPGKDDGKGKMVVDEAAIKANKASFENK